MVGVRQQLITSWEIDGKQHQTLFFGAPKSLQMFISAMKLKTFTPWKESYDQRRERIQKQRHYFAN